MHIISGKRLLDASDKHPDLAGPLDAWYRIAKKATWKTLIETKRDMPSADLVGKFIVFNVKGNAFRLITEVFYPAQVILIRDVLTHSEYDRGGWK